ncbi:MAG TPA: ABC transporter substrate-binding protein [Crenalkalicoccus sp.]|nr:ABC transporter substrate-binding protein [Crenalkalicoccus sp.]
MRRRTLVGSVLLAAALPTAARAQAPPARVGFLHPRLSAVVVPLRLAAVREGLAEAARSNRPVEIVARVADGTPAMLQASAAELVAARPDAILAVSPSVVAAAREATRTTPIVAVDLETDPVAAGWVESLARPGGNLTGVFFDQAEFVAKCLQILAEAVPGLARVGLLWDPSTGDYQRAAAEPAAGAMGIALEIRATNSPAQVEAEIRALAAAGARAALFLSSPLFAANAESIARAVATAGLPAIMLFPEFARGGGLVAYGPDLQDTFRRSGAMARRIVDGAKPADLPVERPVRYTLVLNLRAARALALDLPQLLLARADEVIE